MKAFGIPAVALEAAVDLGADTTAAVRRRLGKRKQRKAAAGVRLRGIYALRRKAALSLESRQLWTTGAFPQQSYGYQINGVSPTELLELRRQAVKSVAGRSFGRCLTTTLACTHGASDPGLALPCGLVKEWLAVWKLNPSYHRRVTQAWPHLWRKLKGAKAAARWNQVKGVLSAVIATLIMAGWDAPTAVRWTRPCGETWKLDGVERDACVEDLLSDLRADLEAKQWRFAAQHYCGKGLEGGGRPKRGWARPPACY